MDPIQQFEDTFDALYGAYSQLMDLVGRTAHPAPADPLALTVTEYLALLDIAEADFRDIPAVDVNAVLTNPFVNAQLDAQTRDFLLALRDGEYETAFEPINLARDFVAGADGDAIIRDVVEAAGQGGGDTGGGDNGGDTGGGDTGGGDTGGGDTGGGDTGGGDTGGGDTGGGDTGGGDTGGGDTGGSTDSPAQTALDGFSNQLNALLWSEANGDFSSAIYSVDDTTGAWSASGDAGDISGSSALSFYEHLGEAVARALLSYVAAQQDLVTALDTAGASQANIAALAAAAETAGAQALETLQDIGAQLASADTSDPASIEAQAAAAAAALVESLGSIMPDLDGLLDRMIIGSRNSDPSFVISPEGTATGSDEGDWFFLSTGADSFAGGAGADNLFGLAGEDSLTGGADNDNLFGGAGDDMLTGGAGNDGIHGGDGANDTANFGGAMGRYTLQMASDGSIVVQDRADGDGTDTLTDIETLTFTEGATIFDDGVLDLSIIQGITGLDDSEIATFVELYIAYFNRAPDALGLYFWGSTFANGTTLEESAAFFLDQEETRATYPEDATNLDFATQVYSNVLGRTADQAGLDFWVGQLEGGTVSRDAFILEVLKGAKADPADGATQEFIDLQLGDRAYLSDKTDIGTYFAVIKGLSDTTDAAEAMQLYVRGDQSSIQTAIDKIDVDFTAADTADSGELILQLVGVADDPFAA